MMKHAKQEIPRLIDAIPAALSSPLSETPITHEECLETDDKQLNRMKMLPAVYSPTVVDNMIDYIVEGKADNSFYLDTKGIVEMTETISSLDVYNDFVKGVKKLDNAKTATSVPDNIKASVKKSRKDYLKTLPKENKVRPNKTL